MRFGFIAKHRGIWPVAWLCAALGVSKSGFHAWLGRGPSAHAKADEALMPKVRASFIVSSPTYGARRVWRDVLGAGVSCGLHGIERRCMLKPCGRGHGGAPCPRTGACGWPAPRPTRLAASSRRSARTRSGSPTSLASGRPKAGSMWRLSSICSHAALSAGR